MDAGQKPKVGQCSVEGRKYFYDGILRNFKRFPMLSGIAESNEDTLWKSTRLGKQRRSVWSVMKWEFRAVAV